jgi:hypothetical protein
MDGKLIQQTIDDLREHLKYVEQALVVLERTPQRARGKRGRKSMSKEERLEVSKRMRSYWASRQREPEAES